MAQCSNSFSTTHETIFYPFSFESRFFVLTSYLPSMSAAARIYFTEGPRWAGNVMLGGGRGELPVVISPPSRFMDRYSVCRKSLSQGVVQYYEPTKYQTDSMYSTALKCDGVEDNGSSGAALPAQFNALKINSKVINYLRTAHFVNFHDKKDIKDIKGDNKLCVYTEDEFDSNTISHAFNKNNLFELKDSAEISAMDVVVVNEELCLYYAIDKTVYKIVLTQNDSKFRAVSPSAVFVSNAPITKIIVPVENRGYVTSQMMVEEFTPYECSQHTSCHTCIGADDPHCGWCTMEAKCSVKAQCTVATQWTKEDSQCLVFSVDAGNKNVRDGLDLAIIVDGISLLENSNYKCQFNSEVNTTASHKGGIVSCKIPKIPSITAGNQDVTVEVYYTEMMLTSPVTVLLGAVSVTYHQCDKYTDCGSCSGIGKFCTWCPYSGQCTLQNQAVCESSAVKKPGQCPAITHVSPEYVDRMTRKDISLDVSNLPPYQRSSNNYRCRVSSVEGSYSTLHSIGSTSTNNTIVCNDVEVTSSFAEHNISQAEVEISIIYQSSSGSVVIVSGKFIVYSCSLLSSDCVGCISTYSSTTYGCKWCSGQCLYGLQCPAGGDVIDSDAYKCLDSTKVTEVSPSWSPVEGGVKVQVLGQSMALQKGVKVQFAFPSGKTYKCSETEYIDSKRLDCTTPSVLGEFPNAEGMITGTVNLLYPSGDKKELFNSSTKFNFTKLHIGPFSPMVGPESGGTMLTMRGKYLCQGDVTVDIGDNGCANPVCKMLGAADQYQQELSCKTPPGSGRQQIWVEVGNGKASSGSMKTYTYSEDPSVSGISPLYTLAAGGVNITVTGLHFDIITSPLLLIGQWSTSKGYDLCTQADPVPTIARTNTTLTFSLPPFDISYGTPHVAFKMDDVTALCEDVTSIEVLENPAAIANNLDIPCIQGKECMIKIQMSHIGPFEGQLRIVIGNVDCKNTTMTSIKGDIHDVTCVPPDWVELKHTSEASRRRRDTSLMSGSDTKGEYNVSVVIGGFKSNIGVIMYQVQTFPWLYVYIGVAAVTVLICIIIALFWKNKMSDKQMNLMDNQYRKEMDQMERIHIDMAKTGFHQLTVMPTLATPDADIDPSNIPYRMFSDYLLQILFPKVDKVKMAQSLNLEQTEVSDYEVNEFTKLLKNKVFLVNFISTIEQQRDFHVANRCEVASYLTVALYSDFNYLSNSLFWFMDSLIDKHIANKSQPKLLLRSTSSVAEKLLTNWLSLSLYGYVKDRTGPALYSLCCAIMNTAECGPVDYCTHQAKFALSQDKLLTEKVTYEKLQIRGEGPDGAKATLTILDCDTITQVKSKIYRAIYKHSPYSQQPNLIEMSLLWYSGQGSGNIELSDDDERLNEGGQSGNKFNTIKTYRIKEGELLKLTVFNEFHQAPIGTLRKKLATSVIERHHIVKSQEDDFYRSPAVQRQQTQHTLQTKLTSELFLTDLINTKSCITSELDRTIKTIFMESNNLPPAIKYLFDYLDTKRVTLPVDSRSDDEIPHVWKTNSIHLRFWVNILKNPEFLFDIHKPPIMDSYLTVMSQCFIDSCSCSEQFLNVDAPANKQLFNNEVKKYKDTVRRWYSDIAHQCNPVTLRSVVHESNLPTSPFKSKFAVTELYKYARKYELEIHDSLPFQGADGTRADFEVLMKKRFSTL